MTNTASAILVLLLGVYAQANNVDLGTNTGFLFLLLLILLNGNSFQTSGITTCSNVNNSLFPNQF